MDLAETTLLKAGKLNNKDVHTWLTLASMYKKKNEKENARWALGKAIEIDSKLEVYLKDI